MSEAKSTSSNARVVSNSASVGKYGRKSMFCIFWDESAVINGEDEVEDEVEVDEEVEGVFVFSDIFRTQDNFTHTSSKKLFSHSHAKHTNTPNPDHVTIQHPPTLP